MYNRVKSYQNIKTNKIILLISGESVFITVSYTTHFSI